MAGTTPVTSSASGIRTGWLALVDRISTACGWVSAAMIVVSVAITCQMIFVRSALGQSTIWQTEMVTYLMVTATLVGLPYVQKLRGHVNVDLIPLMMKPKTRKALALFTLSVSILIVAVMVFYGFEFWHTAWVRNWKSDTVWGVRLWIPYLAMPIGFGLLLLQLIADLAAVVTGVDKPFNLEEGAS
jgi:TRAP-type C4-dicarboxylate transport system permease small subunit